MKATPHHWHTLSFGAGYLGPGVPESDFVGVASDILAAGNGGVGRFVSSVGDTVVRRRGFEDKG